MRNLEQYRGGRGRALAQMSDDELRALGEMCRWNGQEANRFLGYAGGSNSIAIAWRERLGIACQGQHTRFAPRGQPAAAEEAQAPGEAISPQADRLLGILQKAPASTRWTLLELCDAADLSPSRAGAALEELRAAHYDLGGSEDAIAFAPPSRVEQGARVLAPAALGCGEMVMGIVSDTHTSSLFAAQDELEDMYDRFAEAGVQQVLHAGDLSGGPGVRGYPGHAEETRLDCQQPTHCRDYVVQTYPRREGIETLFIGGNHDDWERRKTGRDLTAEIAAQRDDLKFLGRDCVDLAIGPDQQTRVRLLHPDGGTAYAISYHPQKFVEAIIGGDKPHLFVIGHYHRQGMFFLRNVHVVLGGTFEWQTPFQKRKGIEPAIGGYILHLRLDPDGWIREFEPRFRAYYYQRPPQEAEVI